MATANTPNNMSDTATQANSNNPSVSNKIKSTEEQIVADFMAKKRSEQTDYDKKSKKDMMKDFQDYIKQKYPNGILEDTKLNLAFNEISDKGFKVADFVNPEKKGIMETQLKSTNNEQEAISNGLMVCYRKWQALAPAIQATMSFDDFLTKIGHKPTMDGAGNYTGFVFKDKTSAQGINCHEIMTRWTAFVNDKAATDPNKDIYKQWFTLDDFDPSEKVSCLATVRLLGDKVKKLNGTKRDIALARWKEIFGNGEDITNNSRISALESWTTSRGLSQDLGKFFADLAASGEFDGHDVDNLKNTRISTKDCIQYAKDNKELTASVDMQDVSGLSYNQLSPKIKTLTNNLYQTDLINNFDSVLDETEKTEKNYLSTFELPGNLLSFFNQFGTPGNLNPKENDPIYKRIKKQIDAIKLKLTLGRESQTETQELYSKLDALNEELKSLATSMIPGTRTAYFDHIGNKIDAAVTEIGGNRYGSEVKSVLSKLQSNAWNVEILSPSEQAILMKASVDMKLQTMKANDVLSTVGQDFELYRAFVSNLFDFNSDETSFRFQNGEKVTLKFAKDPQGRIMKKFVGKPKSFENVNISDLSALKNIRVEFEVDLDKSEPSEKAEQLLKMVTGNTVIRNFFKRKDFPPTITDSSLVEIVDKHGNKYEGYLSPYGNSNENVTDPTDQEDRLGEQNESIYSSFMLYTKPADQLHTDREIKLMLDKDGKEIKENGKSKAMVVSAANLGDFASITVKNRRATLSDKSINALTLAHKVAEQLDNRSDDQKKVQEILKADKDLASLSKNIKEQVSKDLGAPSDNVGESNNNSFQKSWNSLFPSGSTVPKCENGDRFATTLSGYNKGLISFTVQNVKEKDGVVTSCDLLIENLTYTGSIKPITHTAENLSSMVSNRDTFKLPAKGENYEKIMTSITDRQGKDMPGSKGKYNFSIYTGLKFDDKQGIFYKSESTDGKKQNPITHFISADTNKTNREEFTLKKNSNGTYDIASRIYTVGKVAEKDKKESFFTTTTLDGALLFLAGKGLTAYSEQEHKELTENEPGDEVLPAKDSRRRSVSSIWAVLKGDGKKLLDTFKKKWGEEKEKELRYRIFVEGGIYRKLDGMFGGLLERFELNAFDDMADEDEAKAMDYGREKIKGIFDQLEKFHHSYNYGVKPRDRPKEGDVGSGAADMVFEYMNAAHKKYESGGHLTYKERYKVAGSLMYMMKRYKSGYARSMINYDTGTYVKLLLGGEAYKVFLERYKKKQEELSNDKTGNQTQDILNMMEYNFIVANIRGGGAQDNRVKQLGGEKIASEDYDKQWYYQRLYGREYAKQLGMLVGEAKSISVDPSDKDIKGSIDSGNYAHVKSDLFEHMYQNRIEESVKGLVALQQMATNPTQSDDVIVALMAGVMNGVFSKSIGKDLKEMLKVVARHSGIPFAHWLEHHDAPDKIAEMLKLASGGLDKPFESFEYELGDKNKTPKKYNASDFKGFHREKGDIYGFTTGFQKWMEGPARDQVLDFLHGSNINKNQKGGNSEDNNLFKIRAATKTKPEGNPVIFGKPVTDDQKKYVKEIFKELYFNTDRGYDQSKRGNNYAGLFKRTRTKFDNAFVKMNELQAGSTTLGDHGQIVWGAHEEEAPDPDTQLKQDDQYKLAANVDEFFRILRGIGGISYTEDEIASFYRYVLAAKKATTPAETARLLRFYPLSRIFSKGSIPPDVEPVIKKYMGYFEKNIKLFDENLGKLHCIPSKGMESNFSYVFKEANHFQYVHPETWSKYTRAQQRQRADNASQKGQLIINKYMDDRNEVALGTKSMGAGTNNTASMGKRIDDIIDHMRKDLPGNVGGSISTTTGVASAGNRSDVFVDTPGPSRGEADLVDPPKTKNLTQEEKADQLALDANERVFGS